MKIQPVIQEEPSGCGFACVAMLADRPYAAIKGLANSLGIFAEDQRLWSETTYVRELLNRLGIEASEAEEPFEGWQALPDLALLAIKHRVEAGRPLWHWAVFARHGGKALVLDPAVDLETNEREDFDEIHPAWFIEVKGP